jgi:hypothetical protein
MDLQVQIRMVEHYWQLEETCILQDIQDSSIKLRHKLLVTEIKIKMASMSVLDVCDIHRRNGLKSITG